MNPTELKRIIEEQYTVYWTRGGCVAYAIALRRMLGKAARLVDVVEPEPYMEGAYSFPGRVHHVVVLYRGLLHDVEGSFTEEELLRRWKQRAADAKYKLAGCT